MRGQIITLFKNVENKTDNDFFENYKSQDDKEADICELKWLLDNCLEKLEGINNYYKYDELIVDILKILRKKINDLSLNVNVIDSDASTYNIRQFLEVKYKIRQVLKQLASLETANNWQSPSITNCGINEFGYLQSGCSTYMRTDGSKFIDKFEREFISEYFVMPERIEKCSSGYLTNSGMKALEVALFSIKNIANNDNPIFYQSNFYYEGITLINNLIPDAKAIKVEDIYEKIESGIDIAGLIIDSSSTWPIGESINLERVFSEIRKLKQSSPFFLVIDRTVKTIYDQFFQLYSDKLPNNVILVSVESGLKHYQYGMDITNLGCVVFSGASLRSKVYKDMIRHFISVLSARPNPEMVNQLPKCSYEKMRNRLKRISRNSNIMYLFFNTMELKGEISKVYKAINPYLPVIEINEEWIGGIIYIQLSQCKGISDYEGLARLITEKADEEKMLFYGSSFGFDTMRFSSVEDPSQKNNCALRISVGRYTQNELLEILFYLRDIFINYEVDILKK